MGDSVHFVKLQADNVGGDHCCYYARCTWTDEEDVHIVILDRDKAWNLTLEKNEIEALEKKMRMKEISSWAKEAFSSKKGPNSGHLFSISEDENTLIWKKAGDAGSKMKVKVGSFDLQRMNFDDAQAQVLGEAIDGFAEMKGKCEEMSSKHENLVADLKECRTKCEEFLKGKEKIEDKLYEQFLPILQSKQDKIREMKKRDDGAITGPVKEDGEDSYGSDTDIDEEDGPQKKVAKK